MQIDALTAGRAYGAVTTRAALLSPPAAPGGEAFGSLVGHLVATAQSTGQTAEAEMARQAAGVGDPIRTATSVNAAELALETLVSVRDRMMAAYNDVIRMQV